MEIRERCDAVKLQIDKRSPVYLQIVDYFKEQIASGQLRKGEEIPSRRELAGLLKVNPNTVQRAYKKMEEEGLIFTEGNLPSRVTRDEKVIQHVRHELLTSSLQEFVSTAKKLRIPLEQLVENLKREYESSD